MPSRVRLLVPTGSVVHKNVGADRQLTPPDPSKSVSHVRSSAVRDARDSRGLRPCFCQSQTHCGLVCRGLPSNSRSLRPRLARMPSPRCLHDLGRFTASYENARALHDEPQLSADQPFGPKVVRHHTFREACSIGFKSRPRNQIHTACGKDCKAVFIEFPRGLTASTALHVSCPSQSNRPPDSSGYVPESAGFIVGRAHIDEKQVG